MEDNANVINKRMEELIKIALKGREVDIPIFYSFRSYKTYKKTLSENNDYREAFFNIIYEMIPKDKDTINFNNITIEDVKSIKIEDLNRIAEHIVNSSGIIEKLRENEGFNNSDCFKKVYLMNKKMEENFKIATSKRKHELKLVSRKLFSLTESINLPLKNVYSQVEGVGKIYSQYINRQNEIGNLISPGMKSLIGLSGHMEKIMTPISDPTKLALAGVQSDLKQLTVGLNAFSNISAGIASEMQLKPLKSDLQLGLLNIQRSIPKVGLEIGVASQVLKLQSFEFSKITSNINSTREALINSNVEGIRSVLLEAQVGSSLLESQLKGVKESLSLVTKFTYGNKLVSFDSLHKSILNGIRPFITDLNSIILSRNNVMESIKVKAIAMNSFEWWLISSLPITIINEIYKKKEGLNVNEVDNIICNYYNENDFKELDKVAEKWMNLKYFNKRIDILRESIEVHKLRKYRLTVPTLVPIIEGVIRDFMLDKYKIFNESFSPIYKRFKSKVDELSNFIATYVIVCIDKLYCRFNPTKPNEVSDFSRHKISHGLATGYGSEANSLKVVLFLDEIFEIISSIQEMELIDIS
ncbi:hypothetical protein OSC52_13605 [Clostridium pasteurianum]|uniref:hypothetical protein n=1 Tax=Clostridium pasteurianum TaxID=1501 RepID=UPI00226085C9|nr:hypothetical protein [Clostridium pasteurianum]UZW12885.1 hypothetical protein OSC52_13605 [Clostridium pasteurianum]